NRSEHAVTREVGRVLEAEQRGERREDVDPLDLLVSAPGGDAGAGNHQGHSQQLVVEMRAMQEETVLLELFAVVFGDDNDGRVPHGEPLEAGEQRRKLRVPGADLAIVKSTQVGELLG